MENQARLVRFRLLISAKAPGFYLQERNDLEHEYIYLTEAEAGQFVEESVAEILKMLREYQE